MFLNSVNSLVFSDEYFSIDPQPVSSKFIKEAIGKSSICQSLAEVHNKK